MDWTGSINRIQLNLHVDKARERIVGRIKGARAVKEKRPSEAAERARNAMAESTGKRMGGGWGWIGEFLDDMNTGSGLRKDNVRGDEDKDEYGDRLEIRGDTEDKKAMVAMSYNTVQQAKS